MYDLLLRDATIVSSRGRQVADVAIANGKIVFVGPNAPRRRAKEEISAIGRFLMPGVIDTAVQFDPDGDAAVWERESRAAITGGITTVIALPGGRREVVDPDSARARAERAADRSWCHFGLWGAARENNAEDMLAAAEQGLVVGVLAYAGGNHVRTVDPDLLDDFLAVSGVLGVQIDEPQIDATAQTGLGATLMRLARARRRHFHLMHLSTAAELNLLDPVRGALPVTAGVTPHHLFFSEEGLNGLAEKMRTRPPVRPEHDRRTLWTAVKRGRLDCIASDHHPDEPAGAGVPGAELLFPLMLSAVKYGRLSLEMLVSLCSESPARIFGLKDKGRIETGLDADLVLFSEGEITKVDGAGLVSGAGWSPYADREAAAKPELVISEGQIVARRGRIVADAPAGRWLRR